MIAQAAVASLPPLLTMVCTILAGVAAYSGLRQWGRVTTLALLLAVAMGGLFIAFTTYDDFSIDAQAHVAYVDFIVKEHRLPSPADYQGGATRHPPAFYLASAAMFSLAESIGLAAPYQYARLVPLLCYAVFLLMAVHCLREVLPPASASYNAALLMVTLWPIGLTMGGRINCDLWLYAGLAGGAYAFLRWSKAPSPALLPALFWWAGVAEMGKNLGVLMSAQALLALLITLFYCRAPFKAYLRAGLLASLIFAAASHYYNVQHGWILQHTEGNHGVQYHWEYFWPKVTSFNMFLLFLDTSLGLSQNSFWNMFLHSLLLGGSTMLWVSEGWVVLCKITFVCMLAYGVAGLVQARRAVNAQEWRALSYFLGVAGLIVSMMLYMLLRTANDSYMDGRYAFSSIIGLALLHGIVTRHHFLARRRRSYRLGMAFSAVFAISTLGLFTSQFLT